MLLWNYNVIHKSPWKFLWWVGAICANNWWKNWRRMAIYTEASIPDQWWLPTGYWSTGWFMPRKAGYVVWFSENQLNGAWNAVMWVNTSWEVTVALTWNASLSLIVSSSGTCQITITATGNSLGALYWQWICNINLSSNWVLWAAAFSSWTSDITFTAVANIKALWHMTGTMSPFTELSPQWLADAVWRSLKSQYISADGTMGKEVIDALIAASSGWSPLTTEEHNQLMKALTTSKFIALKD